MCKWNAGMMDKWVKNLVSAIQFITILPIGKPGTFEPGKMVSFFPIVGLLVGAVVAILDQAALHLWSRPVAALIDVIVLAALTGAFHLDGLEIRPTAFSAIDPEMKPFPL